MREGQSSTGAEQENGGEGVLGIFFFFFLVTASTCRELWRAVRTKSSASISPRRRSGRNN